MKKKGVIISVFVFLVLMEVLFLPIPKGSYDDSGTKVYDAFAYKIVVWNRIIDEVDETGEFSKDGTYRKTSVYWYPDNKKSINELWEMEKPKSGKSVQNADVLILDDTYHSILIDSASFDIDGDGTVENCAISYGPTSGIFTVVITASTDEGTKYKNTLYLHHCDIKFCREDEETKLLLSFQDNRTGEETEKTYGISVKDNCIVIEGADESIAYWGDSDWNWNLK